MQDARTIVQAYCDAWLAGDLASVLDSYHADLTLEWPGDHGLAGRYEGLDASLNALARLAEVTRREPTVLRAVCAGDETVVAVVQERWSDDESAILIERALEFEVRDDHIARCRIFEHHQPDVDRWIARHS
ncbi:MAG: nuclear transport factor 2 family protein [Actinomycetota bacterium]